MKSFLLSALLFVSLSKIESTRVGVFNGNLRCRLPAIKTGDITNNLALIVHVHIHPPKSDCGGYYNPYGTDSDPNNFKQDPEIDIRTGSEEDWKKFPFLQGNKLHVGSQNEEVLDVSEIETHDSGSI